MWYFDHTHWWFQKFINPFQNRFSFFLLCLLLLVIGLLIVLFLHLFKFLFRFLQLLVWAIQSRIPVYMSHLPAGTSIANVLHWLQMIISQSIQMYDHGSERENIEHYNMVGLLIYCRKRNFLIIYTFLKIFMPINFFFFFPENVYIWIINFTFSTFFFHRSLPNKVFFNNICRNWLIITTFLVAILFRSSWLVHITQLDILS